MTTSVLAEWAMMRPTGLFARFGWQVSWLAGPFASGMVPA